MIFFNSCSQLFFDLSRFLLVKIFDFVGALTSKPYAFLARSWELEKIVSLDFFDAFCSSVVFEVRGLNFMRVLPFLNDDLNSDWITNKVRFFYDSLRYQRLVNPFIMRRSKYGRRKGLIVLDWRRTFRFLYYFFRYKAYGVAVEGTFFSLSALLGEFSDLILQLVFKDFLNSLGSGLSDVVVSCLSSNLDMDFFDYSSSHFLLKNTINVCLLVSLDLRLEVPNLYSLFRSKVLKGLLRLYSFGSPILNNFALGIKQLPSKMYFFRNFIEGRSFFSQRFFSFRGGIGVLLGSSLLLRNDFLFMALRKWSSLISGILASLGVDGEVFQLKIYSVFEKPSVYSALRLGLGAYGFKKRCAPVMRAFDVKKFDSKKKGCRAAKSLFFKQKKNNKKGRWAFLNSLFFSRLFMVKFLFNLFSDNLYFSKSLVYDFIIYQGFLGDKNVSFADLILPQNAPTEAIGYFINLFGYLQVSKFVFAPPGLARDGSHVLSVMQVFFTKWVLKNREVLLFPSFSKRLYMLLGIKVSLDFHVYNVNFFYENYCGFFYSHLKISNVVGEVLQYDFYRTDALSRASKFLALASSATKDGLFCSSYRSEL